MLKNKNYYVFFNIWLVSLTVLVALIIIVGGLTRLTDSGLSITEWELFSGIFPPTNYKDWSIYFDSYKKIPQYSLLNNNMTLDEFKFIFLWEYAHRLLARFIGLFFIIPFLILIIMKVLEKKEKKKLTYIFILILIQGSLGWYMVKSGLVENISVSHFRLSAHLFVAFLIISTLSWILLNSFYNTNLKLLDFTTNYISIKILLIFIFLQIICGALVSGLDAGRIYQTWPSMNGNFFPDDTSLSNFFNFNQPSFLQFLHRNLAYLILFLCFYIGFNIFLKKKKNIYTSYLFFLSVVLIQVILGISVLISGVNIYLASSHQISSIFLVLAGLNLYYRSISSSYKDIFN